MGDPNVFDLIEVWFGNQSIQARPFEFHTDTNGDLEYPIKAITSCPFCGHGNEVDISRYEPGSVVKAKCVNCGAGENDFEEPEGYSLNSNVDTVTVERDINDIEKEILESLGDNEDAPKINIKSKSSITIDTSNDVQTLKSDCPFVDPIEMGIFVLDEI